MTKTLNNPTIADIAKKAGVSTTTVSRVISNSDRVKPHTRERVQKVINELGYIPNYFAQRLAGNKSNQIGVIVDEIGNFFFTEVLESLQKYLNNQGYSIQISYSKWDENKELYAVKNFISNNVDGIIIAPVTPNSTALELLNTKDFPHVVINCILENNTTCIANDNYNGGKIIANFFNNRKAEKTFIISGWNDQSLLLRIKGFKDNYNNCDDIIYYSNVLEDEKIKKVVNILINQHDIRNIKANIFITNDILAIPLLNYLVESHVEIPNKVSIISYDNIYFSKYARIPLTTIDHGITELCKIASSQLIKKIKGKDSKKSNILIEPKLIFRSSTKAN